MSEFVYKWLQFHILLDLDDEVRYFCASKRVKKYLTYLCYSSSKGVKKYIYLRISLRMRISLRAAVTRTHA
jgi:hypothetical protein